MGDDQWQGEFGFCYAVGSQGVEEFESEYSEHLDEIEHHRKANPKEQAEFEAWLEQQADDMFGPREVA